MREHQPYRLEQGGRIDRERPLRFRFGGTEFTGFEGDTLASALLANGVRVLARSFKYHRPRGIFTSGEEEPCALVEIGRGDARIPSCRAPIVPLSEGLEARTQTGWPSSDFDLGRILDYTHGLWPAGFYNKTFKWPSWHAWEGVIRKASGLGRPLDGPDPDRYERMNWHCDLLICGGGPAGLVAALAAGRAGLRVLLAEQDREPGGSLIREHVEVDGHPGNRWVTRTSTELAGMPNVLVLTRTTVTGVYDHKVTTLLQAGQGGAWRSCYWTVRPRSILLATGSIEQGLIFPNNDRPGIMLAGAVREYLHRYAVVPGREVVVATNNDSGYQTAIDLAAAGTHVAALIDTRPEAPEVPGQRLQEQGIDCHTGARISNTCGTRGIRRIEIEGPDGARKWHDCDLLAVSGGWAPRLHLLGHAGARLDFDARTNTFVAGALPHGFEVAGSAAGPADLSECFSQAVEAAHRVCNSCGAARPELTVPQVTREPVNAVGREWSAPAASRHRQWIDLAHDVTTADAELAVREGYESVEHFKRYTTAGMSIDQGKTSNTNAFLVLSALTGKDPDQTGTTTFRPPYAPVTLGAIAAQATGEFYAPRRYLPAHVAHRALGARFEDYGWQRPEAYPQAGESLEEAVAREVRAVRSAVGVFDNSPIGKLEVRGPDAAEFLDRIYINDVPGLKPGRARYGLMLNENGVIVDDGVFLRLASDHFVVHTTSGNTARIRDTMEEWLQCEWRGLQVVVHDATAQSANLTIAGPRARETLQSLGCDIDISAATLPHMSFRIGKVAGVHARLARVSYSGELSFEANFPARYANWMMGAILDAGERFGIVPFGVEALMVLRTEMGYLHVGSDTDGSTTPDDVGWGNVARKKSRDFIGRRSLDRPGNLDTNRRQLVGLEAIESGRAIQAGGHLLAGRGRHPPAETDGWITSACFSPTLGRHIALAVLRNGRQLVGETVTVCDEGTRYHAKVVAPTFYDPDNLQLK